VKKIEAIIQPPKLEEVKDALKAAGVEGVTISEVRGHGRQKGHTETYRGHEYKIDLIPKVKVEAIVAEALLEPALAALTQAARTGRIGDGKIFVSTIDDVIRIRTGDRGDGAL
jgi:nitrogen regulatory protein P-II 1